MAQLVAEEMEFGQGWNSPSHTIMTMCFSLSVLNVQAKEESVLGLVRVDSGFAVHVRL